MWEFMGLVALVIGVVAVVQLKGCRDAIHRQKCRIDHLAQEIGRIKKSTDLGPEEGLHPPSEAVAEKLPAAQEQEKQRREIPATEPLEVPAAPVAEEVPEVTAVPPLKATPPPVEPEISEVVAPGVAEEQPPRKKAKPFAARIDREWWVKLEGKLGKQWMTWVGAVVLFLSAGFFVKYAFEHRWLTEIGRVILGVIAGIGVTVTGERFVKREMRALGQGLVGAGLAILYVSLYAAYGFYELLPQPITFVLMAIVTAGGMTLAVIHSAIAISILSLLGGLLTPLLLRTGRDPRDALFAYLVLLDLGVLGVAFFKRWRILDILAFAGTWVIFTLWYVEFHDAPTFSVVPTVLWLAALYVVFLIQPFVYHLRLATPIVGERFFMAVSNAAGMFGWAYAILHTAHKHVLGLITLGMSASYLVLGSLTRKRIRTDERAVFGFIALSVMFLTIAIPIHLDFHGVTLAWAVKAPILLYLAYKYSYFPVRAGALISLALAASRIFTVDWPVREEAFTPLFNKHFGAATFVALAGGAYTLIHHLQRKNSSAADRVLKVWTGIASAFLALVVMHIEVWQWLDLSGRGHFVRWATTLVWTAGSAGFLVAGIKLRSLHSRFSGLVAIAVAGILATWDYGLGIRPDYLLIFNGRFLAALGVILAVFSYAFVYRRLQEQCHPDERRLSIPLYGAGIILLVVLCSFEVSQWFAFRGHYYVRRCLLPLIWVAGSASYLATGIRLRSVRLRAAGLATLTVGGILAIVGYMYRIEDGYLPCLNGRFAATFAVPLMVFIHGLTLRRLRNICQPSEEYVSEALYGIGIFLLVLLANVEAWLWLDIRGYHYLARCLVPLICLAGAAGYLGTGIKLRAVRLRGIGLGVLAVAGIFAARAYTFDMDTGYILYLNGRLLAALAVVLMVFAHGFILRHFRNLCKQGEQIAAKTLYGAGTALLFVLLSAETYLYFLATIADPESARWVAQMSLSVVWGTYATAVLVIGFWRGLRSLRLSALGLFGLTALKLVLVDMAKVEEVYRIVSFLVLGILMIGASYLYHRVEKRLSISSGRKE
ncbi:MAG: DUF2339 domain-containing protein [Phycisphaerales bacterium]|nr:MAG: DUF2339 domain-containing protein [Phycisphaerales bacterium]